MIYLCVPVYTARPWPGGAWAVTRSQPGPCSYVRVGPLYASEAAARDAAELCEAALLDARGRAA